eukprot:6193980-Pleurochrysis_carterae.AAC.6
MHIVIRNAVQRCGVAAQCCPNERSSYYKMKSYLVKTITKSARLSRRQIAMAVTLLLPKGCLWRPPSWEQSSGRERWMARP